MEKKFATARLNSAQIEPAQASATAHARPPSSRAITPVSAMIAARQCREKAKREKRIAQEQLAQSKKQDGQRRLIDISENEMSRASDVVKLIAKVSVAPIC